MVSEKLAREIPCCTIFLVLGAVTFQTLTLVGNCKTGDALFGIGGSVSGWSLVGLGLSNSFGEELNTEVEKVQTDLTAAIDKIKVAEGDLDSLLALFGVHIDAHVNKTVASLMQEDKLEGDPMAAIMGAVTSGISDIPKLKEVNVLLVNFLNEITPALDVVGKWILKFARRSKPLCHRWAPPLTEHRKTLTK